MKFLVDAMLGKLAHFLRIFGHNTVYANDLVGFFKRDPIPDEELINYAKKTKRFIITKDYLLYKSFFEKAIYLEGEGIYNYLNQLQFNIGLNFDFEIEKARCSICNSKLGEVKNKNLVKKLVLKETFNHYDQFFQCTNLKCKKIYWEGSHIEDIKKRLKHNSSLN